MQVMQSKQDKPLSIPPTLTGGITDYTALLGQTSIRGSRENLPLFGWPDDDNDKSNPGPKFELCICLF